MSHRDSASFGRRVEYTVFAELLKHGFDIYQTLVDDQGIDCVIRLDDKRYLDIQIKARSKDAQQGNLFAAMTFEPRENLYFVFYTEHDDTFWVMPSSDVYVLGSINEQGKNEGKVSLSLPSTSSQRASQFEKYKNEKGFELLREFSHSTTPAG